MIEAFVHGKLSREQENMEDILTSSVFGLLKHAPVSLRRFLSRASLPDGSRPLSSLERGRRGRIRFWPWLQGNGVLPCEPDVSIEVEMDESNRLLLIEAKFLSGKSSFAEPGIGPAPPDHRANDQLAREWQNLALLDRQGWVIYLTCDYCIPVKEIEESQRDLPLHDGRICWLSCRDILHVEPESVETAFLNDVQVLLTRLDLRPFLGIRIPDGSPPDWSFRTSQWRRWCLNEIEKPRWRFQAPVATQWWAFGELRLPSWRFE